MGIFADFFKVMKSSFFKNTLKNGDYAVPKLSNARALKVDLSSNDNADFDGSKNVEIGVKGVLSVKNGGTGAKEAENIVAGKACTKGTSPNEASFVFQNTNGFGNENSALNGFWRVWNCGDADNGYYCFLVPSIDNKQNIGLPSYRVKEAYIARVHGTSDYADYASTDTSKGTIEERLTNLGFKESSINLYTSGGSRVGSVGLKRQGNYVIADFSINSNTASKWNGKIGTLPENFRPINDQEYFIGGIGVSATGENISISFTLKVYNTGEINIPSIPTASLQYCTVSLGFEAPRI